MRILRASMCSIATILPCHRVIAASSKSILQLYIFFYFSFSVITTASDIYTLSSTQLLFGENQRARAHTHTPCFFSFLYSSSTSGVTYPNLLSLQKWRCLLEKLWKNIFFLGGEQRAYRSTHRLARILFSFIFAFSVFFGSG